MLRAAVSTFQLRFTIYPAVMKTPNLLLLVAAILCRPFALDAFQWDEISLEDLNATECRSDPSAAAEVLYKQIVVDQLVYESRYRAYKLRIKIYKEAAIDYFRTYKISYNSNSKIASVHARVVKPDGVSIELDRKDIYRETRSKSRGRTIKRASFSVPHVEVGDIVEMYYRIVLDEGYYYPEVNVFIQEKWPIRRVDLKIRPFNPKGTGYKWVTYRCNGGFERLSGDFDGRNLGFAGLNNAYFVSTLEDFSAYPEEPYQAPKLSEQAWVTFYNADTSHTGGSYWKHAARKLYKEMESVAKPSTSIKAKAKEITVGIEDSQQKLEALFDYCRSEIVNSAYCKADSLSEQQREKLGKGTPASKVLSQGYGIPYSITALFCALARAEGFDARFAAVSDRGRRTFSRDFENASLALPIRLVTIRNGETWNFYDVGSKYRAFGEIGWKADGVTALVADKKKAHFVQTQSSTPADNQMGLGGQLELSREGTLSGRIQMSVSGNYNMTMRSELDHRSTQERQKFLEEAALEYWPNATVENIEFSDFNNPFEAVSIQFDITIPQYADVVGNRLFLQPCIFHKYDEPELLESARVTDLFFDFKYGSSEKVLIKLPEGYELEAASAPNPFEVESLINYKATLGIKKKTNELIYSRELDFYGRRYDKTAYKIVKRSFEEVRTQDQHTITLKAGSRGSSDNESEANEDGS